MKTRSLLIFSAQILLAITIITSTFLVTHTLKQIKLGQKAICVKGCAEKEITSDFVRWQGFLNTKGESLIKAYEKLETDHEILKEYLIAGGIPLNTIQFSAINTSSVLRKNEQGHETNQIDHYELTQNFSLSSTDIFQITHISQEITSLLKKGLSITSFQPQYFYLKIDELKINMLNEAAKDARLRAEAIVTEDASVGKLVSAQQGVFQITPAFSPSVSDYGEFDTSSIQKRIKAVVTMEFAIY